LSLFQGFLPNSVRRKICPRRGLLDALDDVRDLAQLDDVLGVDARGVAIGAASDQQIDGLREHVVMVMVV
jgi:hypothetical protein